MRSMLSASSRSDEAWGATRGARGAADAGPDALRKRTQNSVNGRECLGYAIEHRVGCRRATPTRVVATCKTWEDLMFEISRRDLVLSAAGAFAAFGLGKPITFIGAAQAQATENFRRYKVGDIEVVSLYDGVWEKPHDENFIKGVNVEQTDAALKSGGLADAHVPIPFTVIAVNTGGRLVLIDSGTGGGQAGGPKAGILAQSMAAAGLDPKAVKTILISHFHGDHISGLMAKDTNAQMFPDAEIIVPAAELAWWTQPVDSIPQARRALAQRIQATFPSWKNVRPVDGEAEVAPGIRAIPAH